MPRVHFVKKARKDYPSTGIQKGDSYYWWQFRYGGTHNVCQRAWLPLKGTSRVYNHAYKERARKEARTIEILAIPCAGNQDNTFKCMMDMVDAILVLTSDVELNPEF